MLLRLPQATPGNSRKVWTWLGTLGLTQPKVVVSHATFLWWISSCKKSNKLMHYFRDIDDQRIPQSGCITTFWPVICEPQLDMCFAEENRKM